MLVNNFRENCKQYQNFAIWEVSDMHPFFNGNATLVEILKKDFKMEVAEFDERRSEISKTNGELMEHMLDQIGDKHFFMFTLHDQNHMQLVQMQIEGSMSFGVDINEIKADHVYILLMDKTTAASRLQI